MYYLHSNGKSDGALIGCENMQNRFEDDFASAIVGIVCDALRVGSRDRRIVESLIMNAIEPHCKHRDKLLEQYLHTQLDILAKKIKRKFGLDEGIQVNYSHATHAKFNDLLDAISELGASDTKTDARE